ncbi:unnamed protein product [Lampetra fluviatilis]
MREGALPLEPDVHRVSFPTAAVVVAKHHRRRRRSDNIPFCKATLEAQAAVQTARHASRGERFARAWSDGGGSKVRV